MQSLRAASTPRSLAYEARVFRATFGRFLPPDRSAEIFEIGCGSGSFLHFLRKEGYARCRGVDQDPAHAAEAERLGISGVSAGDAFEHLAISPSSYDVVVAIDVVEHMRKDELFSRLDAIRGALRPGGIFLWRSPNAESLFAGRLRYGDLTHELSFTRSSAWQLMVAAGFDEIAVIGEEPVVTGARSLARRMLWRIFAAVARLYLFAESCAGDAMLEANLIVRARRPSGGPGSPHLQGGQDELHADGGKQQAHQARDDVDQR